MKKETIKEFLEEIIQLINERDYYKSKSQEMPKVIKEKKGIPTVLEHQGKRYILDHDDTYKPKKKPKGADKE